MEATTVLSDTAPRRSLGRRAAAWAGLVAGCAAAGMLCAMGIGVAVARRVVTPATRSETKVAVRDVHRSGSRLVATLSGPDTGLPGRYSLLFDGDRGHARLGRVLARTATGVEREVIAVDRGRLAAGVRGRVSGWWYVDAAELGHRSERIVFSGEAGEYEAWLVRPRRAGRGRWAVHVHGRGALPEETLRGVAPAARAGLTSLVIGYRNDPGAPAGEGGRYGLGVSESRDVDAAIAEAVRRGAKRVTLFGWSMGGTACLISATRGPWRRVIDGIVLDSPGIDWHALLRYQATQSRIPRGIAGMSLAMLQHGIVRGGEPGGIDFPALNAERFASEIDLPVLVHVSEGDTFVPPDAAIRFARMNPRYVQLRLQQEGEHVKLWNVDPEGWERETLTFVRALPKPPSRPEV